MKKNKLTMIAVATIFASNMGYSASDIVDLRYKDETFKATPIKGAVLQEKIDACKTENLVTAKLNAKYESYGNNPPEYVTELKETTKKRLTTIKDAKSAELLRELRASDEQINAEETHAAEVSTMRTHAENLAGTVDDLTGTVERLTISAQSAASQYAAAQDALAAKEQSIEQLRADALANTSASLEQRNMYTAELLEAQEDVRELAASFTTAQEELTRVNAALRAAQNSQRANAPLFEEAVRIANNRRSQDNVEIPTTNNNSSAATADLPGTTREPISEEDQYHVPEDIDAGSDDDSKK